ncbi:MAG TPA: HAMP domain-containing sensor histidine kinase [Streptosporangiaceae bacterium]|nr:HAMP domain-containing sensor histidine kinase [Streptosporangiaceae bacterium]
MVQGIDSLRDLALTERIALLRWVVTRPDLDEQRSSAGWVDLAWVVLWFLGLGGILVFQRWESIPFHLIWITFALLYSFRVRSAGRTFWLMAAMCVTTFAAIGADVLRGTQPADELTEVPLMAALFWVMMWHGRRRQAADDELIRVSQENERLLTNQRRFLQDASHQFKTPITIALGHSELLARKLASQQDRRDIHVVVGELNRLRALSDRLLLIAASANPDFLRPEQVELDHFIADVVLRWRPAADRCWQLGTLDPAIALADVERLGLAVDALLENAIQHTEPDDLIRLSVAASDDGSGRASILVQDTGTGIAADELPHIFERFSTGSPTVAGRRGTGLGLSLVQAVAQGHGGEVRATSVPGLGSKFEIILPVSPVHAPDLAPTTMPRATTGVPASSGTPDEYPGDR